MSDLVKNDIMPYPYTMRELTLQADIEDIDVDSAVNALELASLTTYDTPALASLYVVAYDMPQTAEELFAASDELHLIFDGAFGTPRDDSFIGAWLDGQLVGAILAVLDAPWDEVPRGPFVLELMVDPEHRRKGIATALIAELAKRAEQWEYDSLTLRLDLKRSPGALPLYQQLGFTEL